MKTTSRPVSPLGERADVDHERDLLTNPEYAVVARRRALTEDLAERLMRYRLDHGLTQKQLADRLGVSDAEISRLENADRLASMATLARYEELLGYRVELRDRESVVA